jgi:hypothetical protein
MCLLKMSVRLHVRFADGEVLRVTKNLNNFLKLRGIPETPVTCYRGRQYVEPKLTETRNNARSWSLLLYSV